MLWRYLSQVSSYTAERWVIEGMLTCVDDNHLPITSTDDLFEVRSVTCGKREDLVSNGRHNCAPVFAHYNDIPPMILLTPRRSRSVLAHPQTLPSSSSVAKPLHQSTPFSPYIVVSSAVASPGSPGYGYGGCGFGIGLRIAFANSECPIALGLDGNGVSKARLGWRDPWEKAR
jgi:hypothetical protein